MRATPRPPKVVLTDQERAELERLVGAYTTGQQGALRARIVLLAGDGWNNLQLARELGVEDETPGHWRRRGLQVPDVPRQEVRVAKRWADAPQPGAPAKFTPEQVGQIIALLACEQPADAERPLAQGRHRELADAIVRRGIGMASAPRQAGRLRKSRRAQAAPDAGLAHARRRGATRGTR